MKVLHVHNYHLIRGGSDVMFDDTVDCLRSIGLDVLTFTRDNQNISTLYDRVSAAFSGVSSPRTAAEFEKLIERERPDIAHVHNVFPLISPDILNVLTRHGVRIVARLADYSLLCPTSHFFRNGTVCQLCLGGREINCFLTNCRGSRMMSAAYAARSAITRLRQVYQRNVSIFTSPSISLKQQFVSAGFTEERLVVVPNLVPIPERIASPANGKYALYVGRVSPEKGISTLLEAAKLTEIPVLIVGDYSHMPEVHHQAPSNVRFFGPIARDKISDVYMSAKYCIVPSLCMESFCLACAESMAHGVPPIASRIGALPELVRDGISGLLFAAGDHEALSARMQQLWTRSSELDEMGRAARSHVEKNYTKEIYSKRLLEIYQKLLGATE